MDRASSDTTSLLMLLADIRAAAGDGRGGLMQPELVDHCRKMRVALEQIRDGDWATGLPDCADAARDIARRGLSSVG